MVTRSLHCALEAQCTSELLLFSFSFFCFLFCFLFYKLLGHKKTFVKYGVVPHNYFAIFSTAIKRFGDNMISFEFCINENGLNRAVLGTVFYASFQMSKQVMLFSLTIIIYGILTKS
jgi:hypothetical protein